MESKVVTGHEEEEGAQQSVLRVILERLGGGEYGERGDAMAEAYAREKKEKTEKKSRKDDDLM